MPAFRFVHVADVHLDSPLRSLALKDPALADRIANATRRAFVGVVDLCVEEAVDALVIAGDLYDGEQTSMKTALFLAAQMRRLADARIRVFVIRGNHDALSRITKELTLPDAVKVFGGRAEVETIDRGPGAMPIAIHGLSFAQPHAPESLLPKYRPPIEGAVNIGLMHTSLGGARGHDAYAPCSLADLMASGHRYWALGHVHKRAVHETRDATVVMPGMPQGRDINEDGPKSVTLVTVSPDGAIALEERPTAIAEFRRVVVDVAGLGDWRAVVEAKERALAAARAEVAAPELVVRLGLVGSTPLAWRLRADRDQVIAEAMARAERVGRVWVETVEVTCAMPAVGAVESGADPIEELRRLALANVVGEAAFRGDLADIVEELRKALPPEARAGFGADEAGFDALIERAATEGLDDVLARLRASDAGGLER